MASGKQQRQKLLILYLNTSALDSDVKGWTMYDGTGREHHTTGDSDQRPYATAWTPCWMAGA